MQISAATPDDLPDATDCLVTAFSDDPLAAAFFDDSPLGRVHANTRFFALLLELRLALNMPVLVARVEGRLVGAAMGDDTAPPEWPADYQQRLQEFLALNPALAARLATYDRIAAGAHQDRPHYNLGLVGVRPGFQGQGIGKALIRAFLDLSDRDSRSQGTALETAAPSNLGLYGRFGFQTLTSGPLDRVTLWAMFCPKAADPVGPLSTRTAT